MDYNPALRKAVPGLTKPARIVLKRGNPIITVEARFQTGLNLVQNRHTSLTKELLETCNPGIVAINPLVATAEGREICSLKPEHQVVNISGHEERRELRGWSAS